MFVYTCDNALVSPEVSSSTDTATATTTTKTSTFHSTKK